MQQVWAQYLHLYQHGERWHLEPELLVEINSHNRDYEAVDPLAERIATRYDWRGVVVSGITMANRTQYPAITWKTATQVCIEVGIPDPKRSDATKVGSIVRKLHEGIESVTPEVVALLERRSDGLRLFAVPRGTRAITVGY